MHRISALRLGAFALAMAASACGTDEPNDPGDAHEFTINFCPDVPQIVGAAQQDGDGAWQLVLPSSGSQAYHFAFHGDRAAIAIKSVILSIYYATPAQLEQLLRVREATCGSKSATGLVAGLAETDTAEVSLSSSGYSWLSHDPGTPRPFQLAGIWSGPQDLVAMARGADVRYIIRTGVDLPDGAAITPLDFTSTEAIAGAHANITVTDVDGDESQVYTTFGAIGRLSYGVPIATTTTYDAVPAANLPAGRVQALSVADRNGPRSENRHADIFFREVVDRTVTLGPSLPDPTITVRVDGPYAFPTVSLPAQPEYGRWMSAAFLTGSDIAATNEVTISAEYFGATPSTWVVTLPDLTSLPGFQPSWAVRSGAPITYSVGAGGGTRPCPFGFYPGSLMSPVDGDETRSIFRWGLSTE